MKCSCSAEKGVFEFANFPGYAVINVSDVGINADIYTGASDNLWKSTALRTMPK